MPLNFINGEPEGTRQEAVAYVTDNTTADSYAAGDVVASISDLVAVDGPEDVVAYMNGSVSGIDEVLEVSVMDGEVILTSGADVADDTDDFSVDEDGGLFFNSDESVSGDSDEAQEIDDTLTADDEVFIYEDSDGNDAVIDVSLGIPLVVQAAGF